MAPSFIPFNRPLFLEQSLEYVRAAYRNQHVSGDGEFSRRCETFLAGRLGAPRVLLTTSCTDALEMCALLLDLHPGDEVLMPAFTFVSTANAFVLRGAKPVFVDIRADTLNLDERRIEAAITARTRAIVVVHYGGIGCEMEAISALAARHGLTVVEDNAHGLFGAYHGRPLGSFGALATLSFHETKNLGCGEGGALVINDPRLIARAEILREKGTDRSRFFRGEIDKYTWIDVGSSFLLSDILAAILWAQIEQADRIQARRRLLYEQYHAGLHDWVKARGLAVPLAPPEVEPSYHLFALLAATASQQRALLAHLKARGVNAVFHYQPLHLTPQGRRLGGQPGQCPVTESVAERIVRLPFHFDLTREEQAYVIAALREFAPRGSD